MKKTNERVGIVPATAADIALVKAKLQKDIEELSNHFTQIGISFENMILATLEFARQGLDDEQVISRMKDIIVLNQYIKTGK